MQRLEARSRGALAIRCRLSYYYEGLVCLSVGSMSANGIRLTRGPHEHGLTAPKPLGALMQRLNMTAGFANKSLTPYWT